MNLNEVGGNCFAPDCNSPLDTLLVGALLVVSAFPSLEPFASAQIFSKKNVFLHYLLGNLNIYLCSEKKIYKKKKDLLLLCQKKKMLQKS
jgi:hypothetical protein